MSGEPRRWTVPGWDALPGLAHAFFARAGGVSVGAYASLNCSERVGDDPGAAQENRRRALQALACERLVVPRQVHGDVLSVLDSAPTDVGEADGVITGEPGTLVGVLTADCVPLLLVMPPAHLAAAVHAGWKGTALAIAARAVERLCLESGKGADAIEVALGPAIDACCYQVGGEVVAALEQGIPGASLRVHRREGDKAWIDLREINAALLRAAGVPAENIHVVGPCTRCSASALFSHRASGGTTGRQLSAIGWR